MYASTLCDQLRRQMCVVKLWKDLCITEHSITLLQNTYVIIVLLYLSKAFDLVDHNILMRHLTDVGVKECDVNWIAEFLHNRKQCTKFKNMQSEFLPLSNAVPQGTKTQFCYF